MVLALSEPGCLMQASEYDYITVHPGVLDYPLGLVFTTASLFLLFSSFNSCLVSQGMQFLLGQKKSLAQGSDLTNSRSKVSPGLSTNLT